MESSEMACVRAASQMTKNDATSDDKGIVVQKEVTQAVLNSQRQLVSAPYTLTPMGRLEVQLKAANEESEQLRQQLADYKADYDAEKRTQMLQAEEDKKEQLRREVVIGVFCALLPLGIEHFAEIVDFALKLLGYLGQ